MQRVYNRREFLKVFGGGIAGAALLGAAGCGGGGAPGDGDEVTLTWWDYWTEGATQTGIQNQIQRYMEAHPNVAVERRTIPFAELKPTLLRSASAGELPDISIIPFPDFDGTI
jgi:multiple sugar transport system substrate-binding protein